MCSHNPFVPSRISLFRVPCTKTLEILSRSALLQSTWNGTKTYHNLPRVLLLITFQKEIKHFQFFLYLYTLTKLSIQQSFIFSNLFKTVFSLWNQTPSSGKIHRLYDSTRVGVVLGTPVWVVSEYRRKSTRQCSF